MWLCNASSHSGILGAVFPSQLSLAAFQVCGIVMKTGYLKSICLSGGDSHLHTTTAICLFPLDLQQESLLGVGDVRVSGEVITAVKSSQMALFGVLTGVQVEVGSRKISWEFDVCWSSRDLQWIPLKSLGLYYVLEEFEIIVKAHWNCKDFKIKDPISKLWILDLFRKSGESI